MLALLKTAPSPSPAPSGGKEASGATPTTKGALAPGRDRFIPVSRYGLRDRLLDIDALDQAASPAKA